MHRENGVLKLCALHDEPFPFQRLDLAKTNHRAYFMTLGSRYSLQF